VYALQIFDVQGPILHWMEFEDDQKTEIDKDLIPAGI